ncbi:unnamed protein product [Orchesella dallaii]|uniref:Uncharacterized protein n=1 Tax=Orchesella dallaii TaxID=48710 RepID=A0ABP1QJ13_9HEXA
MWLTESKEASNCAMYFKAFFNMISSLQWIPYSIVFNSNQLQEDYGVYQVKDKGRILKIIAVAFQIGATFSESYSVYVFFTYSRLGNDMLFGLSMISFFADVTMGLVTLNMIWFRRKLISETINSLGRFRHNMKFWKLRACCMALIMILVSIATGLLSPNQRRIDKLIPEMIINATGGILPGPAYYQMDSSYDSILKVILQWWTFWSGRVASLSKSFLFICAFTLDALASKFATIVQDVHTIDQVNIANN